jgi:hypothetical protein
MKLKDDILKQCLTSIGTHKYYSTALRKMTSTVFLKRGKNYGIAVHVPNETTVKEMAAILGKLSQHFFLVLVQKLSGVRILVP